LATEELGEFAKAVNDNDIEQAKREALDTIAVLVRFIELADEDKN
jgi:NTP pyrophosphatase (non-canonical NTP hydrolase)